MLRPAPPAAPRSSPTWARRSTPTFLDLAERYERVRAGHHHGRSPTSSSSFAPFPAALLPRLRELGLAGKVLLGSDFPNIPYPYADQLDRRWPALDLGDDWLRAVCWRPPPTCSTCPHRPECHAKHEMAIAKPLARGETHGFSGAVDRANRCPREVIDTVVAVKRLGPHQEELEADLVEVILGERRALVGQHRLVADEGDASVEAMLAQRGRQLKAGVTRPGNDDGIIRHRLATSLSSPPRRRGSRASCPSAPPGFPPARE